MITEASKAPKSWKNIYGSTSLASILLAIQKAILTAGLI